MKALIGRKIGMTQLVSKDGVSTPVTVIQAGPCTVTQVKTTEIDGYEGIQLGFGDAKKLSKSVTGHVKTAKVMPKVIREFRGIENDEEATKVGSSFNVSVFEEGDKVIVRGTSKGKGFAGTIRRHNFARQKKTHGGHGNVRRPGSIGSMYPQKVLKGKKMAGQLGHSAVSVKNLVITHIDTENNLIAVKGAIPGPRKSIVTIEGVQ